MKTAPASKEAGCPDGPSSSKRDFGEEEKMAVGLYYEELALTPRQSIGQNSILIENYLFTRNDRTKMINEIENQDN
ncbi:uncharacterized protein ACOB8E_013051 isoform 3-T3 [Sarcophilus harrisii]